MADLTATPKKSGNKTRASRIALRVDLTAMVDLAFLLITFFILTTTLAKPKALDLAMPVGNTADGVSDKRTMTICLGKNNQAIYYLGQIAKPIVAPVVTGYSKYGIRKAIIDMRAKVLHDTGKSMIVLIKPAQSSIFENLVNTLDEMKITGIQQFAIADIAPADISLLKSRQVY